MAKEKDVVEKTALSDGGHVFSGSQSIHETPGPDKLRFDLNENLFGPSPKVKEAIKSFVEKVGVNWYNAWMRKQCAETIAQYAGVKPENVFVCNGSAEILVIIAEVFLQPGDELLTEYPTYRVLLNYAKIYGSDIVKSAPGGGFQHRAFRARIQLERSARRQKSYTSATRPPSARAFPTRGSSRSSKRRAGHRTRSSSSTRPTTTAPLTRSATGPLPASSKSTTT